MRGLLTAIFLQGVLAQAALPPLVSNNLLQNSAVGSKSDRIQVIEENLQTSPRSPEPLPEISEGGVFSPSDSLASAPTSLTQAAAILPKASSEELKRLQWMHGTLAAQLIAAIHGGALWTPSALASGPIGADVFDMPATINQEFSEEFNEEFKEAYHVAESAPQYSKKDSSSAFNIPAVPRRARSLASPNPVDRKIPATSLSATSDTTNSAPSAPHSHLMTNLSAQRGGRFPVHSQADLATLNTHLKASQTEALQGQLESVPLTHRHSASALPVSTPAEYSASDSSPTQREDQIAALQAAIQGQRVVASLAGSALQALTPEPTRLRRETLLGPVAEVTEEGERPGEASSQASARGELEHPDALDPEERDRRQLALLHLQEARMKLRVAEITPEEEEEIQSWEYLHDQFERLQLEGRAIQMDSIAANFGVSRPVVVMPEEEYSQLLARSDNQRYPDIPVGFAANSAGAPGSMTSLVYGNAGWQSYPQSFGPPMPGINGLTDPSGAFPLAGLGQMDNSGGPGGGLNMPSGSSSGGSRRVALSSAAPRVVRPAVVMDRDAASPAVDAEPVQGSRVHLTEAFTADERVIQAKELEAITRESGHALEDPKFVGWARARTPHYLDTLFWLTPEGVNAAEAPHAQLVSESSLQWITRLAGVEPQAQRGLVLVRAPEGVHPLQFGANSLEESSRIVLHRNGRLASQDAPFGGGWMLYYDLPPGEHFLNVALAPTLEEHTPQGGLSVLVEPDAVTYVDLCRYEFHALSGTVEMVHRASDGTPAEEADQEARLAGGQVRVWGAPRALQASASAPWGIFDASGQFEYDGVLSFGQYPLTLETEAIERTSGVTEAGRIHRYRLMPHDLHRMRLPRWSQARLYALESRAYDWLNQPATENSPGDVGVPAMRPGLVLAYASIVQRLYPSAHLTPVIQEWMAALNADPVRLLGSAPSAPLDRNDEFLAPVASISSGLSETLGTTASPLGAQHHRVLGYGLTPGTHRFKLVTPEPQMVYSTTFVAEPNVVQIVRPLRALPVGAAPSAVVDSPSRI